MSNLIEEGIGLARDITGVIDQAVDDGDLRAKLKNAILEKQMDFSITVLTSTATPGYVKFMLAMRDFILPMLRPVGAFCLTAGTGYLAYKGVEIPEYLMAAAGSAFPGWMVSRHANKSQEQKEKTRRAETAAMSGYGWEDEEDL
jgi:hypothetical protein